MSDSEPPYQHGAPVEGMECLCTMEDITEENYVEYQSHPSQIWRPALFEQSVVERLLDTQFEDYLRRVRSSDCLAELRRLLLERGPPEYLRFDDAALPPAAPDTDTHIAAVWFASDGRERPARLRGAPTGADRLALWEELKRFIVVDGREPGDEDDGADGVGAGRETTGSAGEDQTS